MSHYFVLFASPAVLMALVNIYSVKLAACLMTALSSLKLIAMAAIVLLGVWYFIDKGTSLDVNLLLLL